MKNYPKLLKYLFLSFLSLFCLLGTQVSVSAQTPIPSEELLLKSMQERLPALMQLKLRGVAGETNMGLVEARSVIEREQRRLVADENRDRLAHYKLIADKLNIPIAAVQRKRAEQIRENSPKGIWIESKSGDWYQDN